MNFLKDNAHVCKSCTCGNRLKAEKVLFWLVQNSFQIYQFINHFFGFIAVVLKNRIIQVSSFEQALIKTNWKPIQNDQSKTMLLFKTYTLEFEFDRHIKHMVSYQGMQSGLLVFLVREFGYLRDFYAKMTVQKGLIFHISPTTNIKNRSYLDRM